MRALTERKATKNQQQTYLNEYGKEINTVNSTVPIIVDGKVIAAMEVARDITDIKNMSDTILDLQSDLSARNTSEEEDKVKSREKSLPRGIRKYQFHDIIGENRKFEETIARARKAANNDTSVILYGETGVGKELFAQSIHYDGLRKSGPFLAQNCAAIPESLLEGMLFGTDRGALRQDLYYRLGTLSITIPPLRERKDDIPLLVNSFLKKYNERFDKEIWMISDGAETKLAKHDYPGNVRELENIIMAAVSMADEGQHVLTDRDMEIGGYSEAADASGSHAVENYVETGGSLAEYLSGIEETVIRQYLTANDNNVSKTAKDLGMLRQNLQHKIKKYGI